MMNVWGFGKWGLELRHRGWAAVLRAGSRSLWSQQVPLDPIKGRCQVGPWARPKRLLSLSGHWPKHCGLRIQRLWS